MQHDDVTLGEQLAAIGQVVELVQQEPLDQRRRHWPIVVRATEAAGTQHQDEIAAEATAASRRQGFRLIPGSGCTHMHRRVS